MAIVSFRHNNDGERPGLTRGLLGARTHNRRRWPYALGAAALVLVVLGAAAIMLATSKASLGADSSALASISMPLGGGKIESVSVVRGDPQTIPVAMRGDKIYPQGSIGVDELLTVDVTVTRPGWISWLTGKTQHLRLSLTTPVASLAEHYLTLRADQPLRLQFKQPVAVVSYGPTGGRLEREQLASPQTEVTSPTSAAAGSMSVSAAPRAWERAGTGIVSWFPAGAKASAVVTPAPGKVITPSTPISVTFSTPVSAALGSSRPPVANATGHWHTVNDHTIVYEPTGYGYGLANTVSLALPKGIRLVGGRQSGSDPSASWTVPGGSTMRLQQLLANMGYLPLSFHSRDAATIQTPQAEEAEAIRPPSGSFTWRYQNVPSLLRGMWAPAVSGVMTKGAVMAFENDEGLTPDGVPSAAVWHALIAAAVAGHRSTFGYTIAMVSESEPETIHVWHNGNIVATNLVNTGIPGAATALGTYPVFEHLPVGTMSGTNPDGSHYSDPGIPWISYFNGGDALHGFIRGSYGFPQSLGCVEMSYADAGNVYPYTPIGTLVNVAA
ncbi:MAG: L,D-transpeptidase family protein [Solirubrobacteraceae bacterium]